jgi:hypothetical protein
MDNISAAELALSRHNMQHDAALLVSAYGGGLMMGAAQRRGTLVAGAAIFAVGMMVTGWTGVHRSTAVQTLVEATVAGRHPEEAGYIQTPT